MVFWGFGFDLFTELGIAQVCNLFFQWQATDSFITGEDGQRINGSFQAH